MIRPYPAVAMDSLIFARCDQFQAIEAGSLPSDLLFFFPVVFDDLRKIW
jgi:hypothetical protein